MKLKSLCLLSNRKKISKWQRSIDSFLFPSEYNQNWWNSYHLTHKTPRRWSFQRVFLDTIPHICCMCIAFFEWKISSKKGNPLNSGSRWNQNPLFAFCCCFVALQGQLVWSSHTSCLKKIYIKLMEVKHMTNRNHYYRVCLVI